jgi:peroxiredoxin
MKTIALTLLLLTSVITFSQEEMYDICPIKNSESVPKVIVYDQEGKEINLKSYIGEKPVVVVFYRGGWCPYCMRHLAALNEIKPIMDSLGVELIAITPDDFTNLDSSVVKGNGVDFKLFSDKDVNAINAFGIGWEINDELYLKYKNSYGVDSEWWSKNDHHVLPVPSVFIIKDGKIEYQHVNPNYSKRLSPEMLLNFIESE